MDNLNLNIKLTFNQLLEVVKQLSPVEKLELNNVLWESKMDIPKEHQERVLESLEKSKNDPSRVLDWEEV